MACIIFWHFVICIGDGSGGISYGYGSLERDKPAGPSRGEPYTGDEHYS